MSTTTTARTADLIDAYQAATDALRAAKWNSPADEATAEAIAVELERRMGHGDQMATEWFDC